MSRESAVKDEAIIEAIHRFDGMPTTRNLSAGNGGPVQLSAPTIFQRLKNNPSLQKAIEDKRINYLQNCSPEEFYSILKRSGISKLSEEVRHVAYVRMDQLILEAIEHYDGIPTSSNLSYRSEGPLPHEKAAIQKRMQVNSELADALKRKGIEFILSCDKETFVDNVNSGRWNNVSQDLKNEINRRIDLQIHEAIVSFDGIATASSLSKIRGGPLPYAYQTISQRLKSNQSLQDAQEKAGELYVLHCSDTDFEAIIAAGGLNRNSEHINRAMLQRLDTSIAQAIWDFDGIASGKSLCVGGGGTLKHDVSLVLRRFEENPSLKDVLEEAAISFVMGCETGRFMKAFSGGEFTQAPDSVKEAITKRLDMAIMEKIKSYQGIPTIFSIIMSNGGPLDLGYDTVRGRHDSNPEIREAAVARGIEYVSSCDLETFSSHFQMPWNVFPSAVVDAMAKRLDLIILDEVGTATYLPTPNTLSATYGGPLPFSVKVIQNRIESNDTLRSAVEKQGISIVGSCTSEYLSEVFAKKLLSMVAGSVETAAYERLDSEIVSAIRSFEGVPSPNNLSSRDAGPLPYSEHIIVKRTNVNPRISQEIDKRGVEFVQTCGLDFFVRMYCGLQWVRATGKVREAIDTRLDEHIHSGICKFEGDLSYKYLCSYHGGPLPYSTQKIMERIKKNPNLRRAFLMRKGFTEDQINALEAEQENPSFSFLESIQRRLPNTRIFRESLGILDQFREIIKDKILEISFYPDALRVSSTFLDEPLEVNRIRAQELKDDDFSITETGFNTVAMLQCFHRLSSERLVRTFNEINKVLVDSGILLVSFPRGYARTGRFKTQAQDFGFELQTEGRLFTRTLSHHELDEMGISDARRIKQKIEQSTNVLILVKTRSAIGHALDPLYKCARSAGDGLYVPSLGEINTPLELLRDLSFVFQEKRESLESGYLLTILDDASHEEQDLVAYDLDPRTPQTIEVHAAKESLFGVEGLKTIARRMDKDSFREKLLVKPGHETKIPARFVKQLMNTT